MDFSAMDQNNLSLDPSKRMLKADFQNDQIANLMSMGFSQTRCQRAMKEAGNDVDNALNLLLANVDNPDWDKAEPSSNKSSQLFSDVWEIAQNMGVGQSYVKKICQNFAQQGAEYCLNYLFEHPYDSGELQEVAEEEPEKLVFVNDDGIRQYELVGGVVHLGKSVHVGHYVTFAVRTIEGVKQWVYFNDEKVWKAFDPKVGSSYILLFRKIK